MNKLMPSVLPRLNASDPPTFKILAEMFRRLADKQPSIRPAPFPLFELRGYSVYSEMYNRCISYSFLVNIIVVIRSFSFPQSASNQRSYNLRKLSFMHRLCKRCSGAGLRACLLCHPNTSGG